MIAAAFRKSPKPAFGYIITVLGQDYRQEGTRAEAQQSVDTINERCKGLNEQQVRELYKLGHAKA